MKRFLSPAASVLFGQIASDDLMIRYADVLSKPSIQVPLFNDRILAISQHTAQILHKILPPPPIFNEVAQELRDQRDRMEKEIEFNTQGKPCAPIIDKILQKHPKSLSEFLEGLVRLRVLPSSTQETCLARYMIYPTVLTGMKIFVTDEHIGAQGHE